MIKKFSKFLEKKEDNYREDEHSHLNDPLHRHELDDEGMRYLNSGETRSSFRDHELEDDVEGDDMDHLLYLLRTMFKNSGVEVQIDNRGLDIMIYALMDRKERLKDIINVLEVANKLKKDILPQYDSELEMWETRKGQPMMVFNFLYGEGLGDDNDDGIPF